MPFVARLDMSGIGTRNRTVEPILRAMGVDPVPSGAGVSVGGGEVDGLAVAVTAGRPASTMLGISGARLEAGGEGLAVVVAERAQHGPVDSIAIHRVAGVIELLAEVGVHAADHVALQRYPLVLCRGGVLPCEVSRRIRLDRLAPVNLPQVLIDFFDGALHLLLERGDGAPGVHACSTV